MYTLRVDQGLDLARYGERIGFSGPYNVDFDTLNRIQFGHTTNVPFENISVLRDQPVLLDDDALFQKLVVDRRGGYCFEQNGLLLAVLKQIGFNARPHAGRVRIDRSRDFLPPRTHLFIQVDLDGQTWLVDAGVGGLSLTTPIRFELNIDQATPHEPRRIVYENGVYFHQAIMAGGWVDVYEFTGEGMPMIDREVSNWWTSTNPNSKFKQGLFCALGRPNGERFGILNNTFTHRHGTEILRRIEIESLDQLHQVLVAEFGLNFPVGTSFGSAVTFDR